MQWFEILHSTFDLQPPSSLLKLNESAGKVGYWIEQSPRVKESSLDPLYRQFRYSSTFLVLPRSSLPFLATMQNQSLVPSPSNSGRRQSVAALLPEELLDHIFAQFGFDYSPAATVGDRQERYSNLSNMSMVAEGWSRPARRLLFRSVRIWRWSHLQEEVEEGLGKLVRDLEIAQDYRDRVPSLEPASAVFKLLKRLPNLRRLRLVALPFDSFNAADSASMHAAVLFPHLHDLNISDIPSPDSLIVDLLATSGHRIDRLSVHYASGSVASHAVHGQLDFRGK